MRKLQRSLFQYLENEMIYLERTSGIRIPYAYPELISRAKRMLTRTVKEYTSEDVSIVKFYEEDGDYLLVPRYFPIHKCYSGEFVIEDNIKDPVQIPWLESKIKLRDEAQELAYNYLIRNENGILQLPPGSGKTVISIHMICTRKLKTIILTHRSQLVDQWFNRFLDCTNIELEQIGTLRSRKNISEELQKPIVITTDQFFISQLKEEERRTEFLDLLKDAGFGVFIADEVHTSVGAPTFSKCSILIPTKYSYGLSATPYRFDGNSDIIQYHLGDVFQIQEGTTTMRPLIVVILGKFTNIQRPNKYIYWNNIFQRPRYITKLCASEAFFKLCCKLLRTAIDKERNILFICERIKFITKLVDLFTKFNPSTFIQADTLENLDNPIVLATPQKIRDGIDAPHKDCLIMATPVQNVEQLCGRILRIYPGKKDPVFFDIVDFGCAEIASSYYTRLKVYNQKQWDVEYRLYDVMKNKIENLSKSEALQILNNVTKRKE